MNVLDGLATAAGDKQCACKRGKVEKRFGIRWIFSGAAKGQSVYYTPQNAFTVYKYLQKKSIKTHFLLLIAVLVANGTLLFTTGATSLILCIEINPCVRLKYSRKNQPKFPFSL